MGVGHLREFSVAGAGMLEMEAGVTPVSPTSHVKALDVTPEQCEAIESFQQRSGVVRFALETSPWLERGEMIGEKKLHPAAVSLPVSGDNGLA